MKVKCQTAEVTPTRLNSVFSESDKSEPSPPTLHSAPLPLPPHLHPPPGPPGPLLLPCPTPAPLQTDVDLFGQLSVQVADQSIKVL